MNTNDKSFSRIKHPKKEKTTTPETYTEPVEQPAYSFGNFLSDLGNQQVGNLFNAGFVQAKLNISQPGDVYELEADRIANTIVAGNSIAGNTISKTSHIQKQGSLPEGSKSLTTETKINNLGGTGKPLDKGLKAYFEPRFGVDLENVRIHTDSNANRLSQAIHAKAFTLGNDIAFAQGEFKPGTAEGKKLIAHELTHVVQQRETDGGNKSTTIQRTIHGPSTPTNAHNWRIPLPPWIAGVIAHRQISSSLGIPSLGIPRASKVFMGIPNPPAFTPYGFADLWNNSGGKIDIAEIKSTSTGDALAHLEAAHYINRHNEWLSRSPHGDLSDLNYLINVGGLLPADILDLSRLTGTDKNLGPFWGDPMKNLHIEADRLGAIVYWCTGNGVPVNPVWYWVLKDLLDRLKKFLDEIKKMIQQVVDAARPVVEAIQGFINSIVEWGIEHSRVLAFILLIIFLIVAIIIIILCILGEIPSGGTSTAGVVAGAAAAVVIVVGLGALIGTNSPNLPDATANVTMTLFPEGANKIVKAEDYEKGVGVISPPSNKAEAEKMVNSYDPYDEFLAAAQPYLDPINMIGGILTRMDKVPANGAQQLNNAIAFLEQHGDGATAKFARQIMAAHKIA